MSPSRYLREFTPVTTALACLVILSSCGDDVTVSKDSRGILGEMEDVIKVAEDYVLTGDRELWESLDVMWPLIQSTIHRARSVSAVRVAVSPSCFPDEVMGHTFEFDGISYSGHENASMSDYSAHFSLYRLSDVKVPILSEEIGSARLICLPIGSGIAAVDVFNDSVRIATMTYSPSQLPKVDIEAALTSDDGSRTLEIEGLQVTADRMNLKFFISDLVSAEYLDYEFSFDGARSIQYSITRDATVGPQLLETSFILDSENLMIGGAAILKEGSDTVTAACVNSGTPQDPVFTSPSGDCFIEGLLHLKCSDAQLESLTNSHHSLRTLWLRTTRLAAKCRTILTP